MDEWKKINETSLPKKEYLNSNLNIENITDLDYYHAKRLCKDFKIRNLGKYHDFYSKRDKLLLADVFENFRKMCFEIYKVDHAKFISAPGLAQQADLKKTNWNY